MSPLDQNSWIRNSVCKVFFAGFESDTWTLQQNGWQISCNREMYNDSVHLAFHHEQANLYAMSSSTRIPREAYSNFDKLNDMVFYVNRVNSTYRMIEPIQCSPTFFNEFEPIDCTPTWRENKDVHLSQFKIFKPVPKDKEILIGPQSVAEALEFIQKLQDPKQQEIREKHKKERLKKEFQEMNSEPEVEYHAQIISLRG